LKVISHEVQEATWKSLTARALSLIAVSCLLLSSAVAQGRPAQFVRTQATQGGQSQYQPPRVGHRGDWLKKYGNLPSDQATRQLQQDKDFQRLPSERQQELQQRLQHFSSLPPQQKQRVLNRMALMEHLPPDQQKRMESLWQQFRELDPARRRAVVQQLRGLSGLPAEQRSKILDGEQFKSGFNPQEQQLVRGLDEIHVQLHGAKDTGN
jgi:hypothetical protein